MNREDIIRMAREAGVSPVNDQQIKFEGPMWLCLERFAALVAAHEREACAKLAGPHLGGEIAAAIRARGET